MESKQWDFKIFEQGPPTTSRLTIRANPSYASKITKRMEPYKHFPRHLRPALENVADYVTQHMIPQTFENEGPGWRPLARRTIGERIAQGFPGEHPILRRSGDLYKELTERSHPKHVEVIKVGKYSRIEIGGSSEKFLRNQMGEGSLHIPPRPMIPGTGWLKISSHDRLEIRKILQRSIKNAHIRP